MSTTTSRPAKRRQTAAVETLHAAIDELEASIAKFTEDITDLTKDVAELDAAVYKAIALRQAEKAKL